MIAGGIGFGIFSFISGVALRRMISHQESLRDSPLPSLLDESFTFSEPEIIEDNAFPNDPKEKIKYLFQGKIPARLTQFNFEKKEDIDRFLEILKFFFKDEIIPAICELIDVDFETLKGHFYFTISPDETKNIRARYSVCSNGNSSVLNLYPPCEPTQDSYSPLGFVDQYVEPFNNNTGEKLGVVNVYNHLNAVLAFLEKNKHQKTLFPFIFIPFLLDTALEEIIHFHFEKLRFPSQTEKKRIRPLIEFIINQRIQDYLYQFGITLFFQNESSEILGIFKHFGEAINSYLKYCFFERLFSEKRGSAGKLSPFITFNFINYPEIPEVAIIFSVNKRLGISDDEFMEVLKNQSIGDLVNFYKDKGRSKGYQMNDEDIFTLFKIIDNIAFSINEEISKLPSDNNPLPAIINLTLRNLDIINDFFDNKYSP